MKFRGITIEQEYYGKDRGKFKGRIQFESDNNDSIYLNLDNEWSKKLVDVCLPLFVEATNERIEIIKEELGIGGKQ